MLGCLGKKLVALCLGGGKLGEICVNYIINVTTKKLQVQNSKFLYLEVFSNFNKGF
jgi:hypothetical protein